MSEIASVAPPVAGRHTGKVALVTGGGTGIGAATAARLAAEGARVVVTGRRSEPLEAVAGQISGRAIVADMSDPAQVKAAVQQLIAEFGRLDLVVANAGAPSVSAVADTSDESWRASMAANVDTAFFTLRETLPALLQSRGSAVLVSSTLGLSAGPKVAEYTTAKHAVIGLAKSAARDYSGAGVRVNTVCPGWVRTAMSEAGMAQLAALTGLPGVAEAYAKVTEQVPIGRAADPAEIASIISFLGSAEASYVTGATIAVDGGADIVDLPTLQMTGVF